MMSSFWTSELKYVRVYYANFDQKALQPYAKLLKARENMIGRISDEFSCPQRERKLIK